MVTLHEVITFLVSMQISISSLQTHNVNRCGRSRHLTLWVCKLLMLICILTKNVRSEERFSRNAETDLVCRLLLEKKKKNKPQDDTVYHHTMHSANSHRGTTCHSSRVRRAYGHRYSS